MLRFTAEEFRRTIDQLTLEMKNAAKILEFEHAAYLRDKIRKLKEEYNTNPVMEHLNKRKKK